MAPPKRAPAADQVPEAAPAAEPEPELVTVHLLNAHTTSRGFTGPGLTAVPLDEAVLLQAQGYARIVGV